MIELGKKNVFVYWVGPSYSLIDLLRKIMLFHSNGGINYQLHVINHQNINEYLNELPEKFYSLIPAYQADYVRVAVLERFGGIWLDSDTLVMSDLNDLFSILETKQGFFIRQNNNLLCNGVFGARAGTPLLTAWRQAMLEMIAEKGNNLIWSELGNLWLEEKYQSTNWFNEYTIFQGLDTMYPANWDVCVDSYLRQPYNHYTDLIRPFQPLLVLVGMVYRKLEHHNIADILAADYPLNYFIKKSLDVGLGYSNKPDIQIN
jgi:hypothetical protein